MTTVRRWVAECDYFVSAKGQSAARCPWNERPDKTRHANALRAQKEAAEHAREAGHVGAREVQVQRTWKPRELEREEIVGG